MKTEALLKEHFLNLDFDKLENKVILEASSNYHLGIAYKTQFIDKGLRKARKWAIPVILLFGLSTIMWQGVSDSELNEQAYFPKAINIGATAFVSTVKEKLDPMPIIDSKGMKKMQEPIKNTVPLMAESAVLVDTSSTEIEVEKIIIHLSNEVDFPEFSEEQIKAHRKQKQGMLRDLLRLDKKEYAQLKAWKRTKEGEILYMKTMEVSNLEYRTFLNDLILNNKKEAYTLSKVTDSAWLDDSLLFMEAICLTYSWHKLYNDYPVVNINRIGAKLFCNWLLKNLKEYSDKNNQIQSIRLPFNNEWEFAASAGNKEYQYPWGGPYIRNNEGCFLANFRPYRDDFGADGGLTTVTVNSYAPNDFGLFNMAGNAAEMVVYEDGSIGTKGGSWSTVAYHLQINSPEDPFKGIETANRNIGFRPIIVIKSKD